MKGLSRIIIGIMGFLFLILAIIGFIFGGAFAALLGPAAGALMSFFPIIALVFAILGLWGAISGNRIVQIAFSVLLLPFWNVGTIVGAVCLVILYIARPKEDIQYISTIGQP